MSVLYEVVSYFVIWNSTGEDVIYNLVNILRPGIIKQHQLKLSFLSWHLIWESIKIQKYIFKTQTVPVLNTLLHK